MRKVIRTMAAVAMLFATTTVLAKEPKLETDGISKSLHFEWETKFKEASLKIFDTNGTIMYSDYINVADAYAKKFDLSPLSKGAYFLKIENGSKELLYSIILNEDNVSILGKEESTKPAFRKDGGQVYLNFLNRSMEEVKLKVTDSFGNVLFEETVKDSFVVEKAFNFKNAFEGDYTIMLREGKRTFYETIRVK